LTWFEKERKETLNLNSTTKFTYHRIIADAQGGTVDNQEVTTVTLGVSQPSALTINLDPRFEKESPSRDSEESY
jgi:hypothetical protein